MQALQGTKTGGQTLQSDHYKCLGENKYSQLVSVTDGDDSIFSFFNSQLRKPLRIKTHLILDKVYFCIQFYYLVSLSLWFFQSQLPQSISFADFSFYLVLMCYAFMCVLMRLTMNWCAKCDFGALWHKAWIKRNKVDSFCCSSNDSRLSALVWFWTKSCFLTQVCKAKDCMVLDL